MGHGTEHHLEHAEHAQHAAHDPFDRRVAMSMAIIAATLAAAAMFSHRGHTETLRLETAANIDHTQASDMWNFYQAKNIRTHEYVAFAKLAGFAAAAEGADKLKETAIKDWSKQIERYQGPDGKSGDLAELKKKAETLVAAAKTKQEESHHWHEHITWVDFGHLGLELALVLCSIAVLTKQRSFWYTGIVAAVLGAAVALVGVYGIYAPHEPHHEAAHETPHPAPHPTTPQTPEETPQPNKGSHH